MYEYALKVHQVQLNQIQQFEELKKIKGNLKSIKSEIIKKCSNHLEKLKEIKTKVDYDIRMIFEKATSQLEKVIKSPDSNNVSME